MNSITPPAGGNYAIFKFIGQEQDRIQGKEYNVGSDIWSLGIILFMLVTGEPPVAGSTSEEILENVKAGRLNLYSRRRIMQFWRRSSWTRS